jgi:hypothetical protein
MGFAIEVFEGFEGFISRFKDAFERQASSKRIVAAWSPVFTAFPAWQIR